MSEKQLIVAVEGTAAMGPFWQSVVYDYLEKIIRCFCGNELAGLKASTSSLVLNCHWSPLILMDPIVMLSAPNGSQNQQNVDGLASNPHPLPTPVYRLQMQNLEQSENIKAHVESHLSDAETVAKSFFQVSKYGVSSGHWEVTGWRDPRASKSVSGGSGSEPTQHYTRQTRFEALNHVPKSDSQFECSNEVD